MLGSLQESYDNFLSYLIARNADDLDWENIKGLLIEEFFKRAEKSEKQEADNALYFKRESFSVDIFLGGRYQARGGTVVIAVHVFGRKILCLAMMIMEISKELHASNVSWMGTWQRIVHSLKSQITSRTPAEEKVQT